MSSTALLRTCFDIMHFSGAARLARPFLAGEGVIFCLHRVVPGTVDGGFSPNAKLQITPEFLSEIIGLMRELGYDLLSIGEAVERLKGGKPSSGRFAIFTLDDGYLDNLLHAMPVFARHACPFTVYVAPRIAEGTCELWWIALEQMIAAQDELNVDFGGTMMRFPTRTMAEKHNAWRRLQPHVQAMPEYAQRDWIRRTSAAHDFDVDALCRGLAMTWDQIRFMNKSPLCTIGAHTLNHYNLLRLPEDDARREIAESGRLIAEQLGEPVQHFAYPYGNVDAAGPREFSLAAQAGYQSSVVTRLGPIYREHGSHLQALPRVMVSGRFQSSRAINALSSGLPPIIMNKFRRINVG